MFFKLIEPSKHLCSLWCDLCTLGNKEIWSTWCSRFNAGVVRVAVTRVKVVLA